MRARLRRPMLATWEERSVIAFSRSFRQVTLKNVEDRHVASALMVIPSVLAAKL